MLRGSGPVCPSLRVRSPTTYDPNGYQATVTDWQSGTVTIDSDPDGRIESVTRSSGVTTAQGFDDAGRLTGPGGSIDSLTTRWIRTATEPK